MTRIALVACSKTKSTVKAPAAALYTSSLFRKSLLAALDISSSVYIVSAKHGLLRLDQMIEPYDVTLKRMPKHDRLVWAENTGRQLADALNRHDVVTAFCGNEYIYPLRSAFSQIGCRIELPLHGLSLGKRLSALRTRIHERELDSWHSRFIHLMKKLSRKQNGGRLIANCSGRLDWPRRGVYFVTEESETAQLMRRWRVVRVGTHAVSKGSRTTLWDRLSTHRGTERGGGSHRSSIFRLHVGRAVANVSPETRPPTSWGLGQSAPSEVRDLESEHERRVSDEIGRLRLLWINVPDEPGPGSDRAYIEKSSIGLLSRAGLLSPKSTKGWLGQLSTDWRISLSGLWNLDHLFHEPDDKFLDVLEEYVDFTIGNRSAPANSLAPVDWRERRISMPSKQLDLF